MLERLEDGKPNMPADTAGIFVAEVFGVELDQVKSFVIVGALVPEDGRAGTEIRVVSPSPAPDRAEMCRMALTACHAAMKREGGDGT